MGFNLKEKLQNVNKKNVAIVAVILFVLLAGVIAGFEYYNFKKVKAEAAEKFEERAIPVSETGEPLKPSEYKIGIEFNKAMKGKKPILALFYADWCHYCIKFMPVYQELSEKYKDSIEFSKVNVEDPKYEDIVKNIGITGFPTVYILDPKYDNKVLLSNSILGSTDGVSKELDRFLRIRQILDKQK